MTRKSDAKSAKEQPSNPSGNDGSDPHHQEEMPVMPLMINAQYVKDLSFENPNPLEALQQKEAPEITLNVDVNAKSVGEKAFEVILHLSADAKSKEGRLFLIELQYGGIFTIGEIPEESVHPLLLIECPRILFPYARQIIANATREGGFPSLALQPIDFVELYRRQHIKKQEQEAKKATK